MKDERLTLVDLSWCNLFDGEATYGLFSAIAQCKVPVLDLSGHSLDYEMNDLAKALETSSVKTLILKYCGFDRLGLEVWERFLTLLEKSKIEKIVLDNKTIHLK